MNIIGKILVILNLVFALVVGGFLVIDFAARSNWKTAYENLARETKVQRDNFTVSGQTMGDLNVQVKRAVADLEAVKQKLVDAESTARLKEDELKLAAEDASNRAKEADLNFQKALAEKERLKVELKDLTAIVAVREKTILAIQDDAKKYRTEASAQKSVADTMQLRNQNLLEQIVDLTRKLASKDAGSASPAAVGPRNTNQPNPPSAYVKGQVDKVYPSDKSLVQINLGSDHGVAKNNTLEVFRKLPEAKYLGMVRVVDVFQHHSVVQLLPNPITGNRSQLKEGDIVASSLGNP